MLLHVHPIVFLSYPVTVYHTRVTNNCIVTVRTPFSHHELSSKRNESPPCSGSLVFLSVCPPHKKVPSGLVLRSSFPSWRPSHLTPGPLSLCLFTLSQVNPVPQSQPLGLNPSWITRKDPNTCYKSPSCHSHPRVGPSVILPDLSQTVVSHVCTGDRSFKLRPEMKDLFVPGPFVNTLD